MLFTDDLTGSTIISVMVILSTLLRYWQEAKSNQAADALKAMVSNTATVLRHQVSAEDLELMHERYGIDIKTKPITNLKCQFNIWCQVM